MRIVLYGGFGNQLFQLNFANYLRKKAGVSQVVVNQALNKIKAQLNSGDLVLEGSGNGSHRLKSLFVYCVYRFMFKFPKIPILKPQTDLTFVDNSHKECTMIGYWQNTVYCDKEFSRSCLNFELPEVRENVIAIHVRGGDYLTKKNKKLYANLDSEFYERALRAISSLLLEDYKVEVVTNDIEYAIEVIDPIFRYKKNKIDYINKSLEEDFKLLASAEFLLSSNSTFCWWAGFLGHAQHIVQPAEWSKFSKRRKFSYVHKRAIAI
jgi:hypothetical protein